MFSIEIYPKFSTCIYILLGGEKLQFNFPYSFLSLNSCLYIGLQSVYKYLNLLSSLLNRFPIDFSQVGCLVLSTLQILVHMNPEIREISCLMYVNYSFLISSILKTIPETNSAFQISNLNINVLKWGKTLSEMDKVLLLQSIFSY